MTDAPTDELDPIEATKRSVVDAALTHVVFDGWSDKTLKMGVEDAGVDPSLAKLAFPRGGVDLALAFHYAGDRRLKATLAETDLSHLRYSERVGRAVEIRLELIEGQRDAVRRAASLLALPQYAADGARAIWNTADTIWTALGDTSTDYNWYTKRATLSAVYSSSVLYWLGDDSEGHEATRAFIARRIDDVMQFEKFRSRVAENPVGRAMMAGPTRLLERIRAPERSDDNPTSRWTRH